MFCRACVGKIVDEMIAEAVASNNRLWLVCIIGVTAIVGSSIGVWQWMGRF